MTTSGLNDIHNTFHSEDILLQNYPNKEAWVLAMPKWSRQYRREYSKLYYKIYIKENAKQTEKELFSIMGKKNPKVRNSYDKTNNKKMKDKSSKLGLNVEIKKVKINFD